MMFYWLLIHIHTSYSTLDAIRTYYTFVDCTVWADDTVLAQTQLQLKYYGKCMNWSSKIITTIADINIYPVAEHSSFTLQLNGTNENTMLVCSATGGYPPITKISLLKNGGVIASAASESTLQVNIADLPPNINRYGLYVCLVDLSGIPLQQSVVLDKRGSYNVTRFFISMGH